MAWAPNGSLIQKSEETKTAERVCKEVNLRYSLPTLFGNWYETQYEKYIRIQKLEEKRESGNTFNQKKLKVIEYLTKPLELEKFTDSLFYDVAIKLKSDYTPPPPNDYEEEPPQPKQKSDIMYGICTMIRENMIDANQLTLCESCPVTINDITKHKRRNVFCFECLNKTKSHKQICYNEDLYIRLYDSGTALKLYVRCEVPSVDAFGTQNHRFMLKLTENPDRYSIFKILNADTTKQLMTLGFEVPSNSRILICHAVSNQLLANEWKTFYDSKLFDGERVASCFNYRDVYRQPTSENYWIAVTKQHGEDARQMDAEKDAAAKKAVEDEALKAKLDRRKADRERLMEEVICTRNPIMNFIFLP